jgi:shikimate dehydrogenase
VLDRVRPDTVIADIIMVPAETEWLVAAQKAGLRVHYGRHMLDYQIDLIGKFIGAL